jgi:hypothetical protein
LSPKFHLFEYVFAAPKKLCYPHALHGGIVFEVAFGGVSDGVGTDRIECVRAMPITYRRDRRKSPLDAAQRPRYGLSGSTPGAMRLSRYDRRKSPLDAAQRPRCGLRGSTPGAMLRSCYDRRKSPLDEAQRPRYGLSGGALDATLRSCHDRRIGPLDAAQRPRYGLSGSTPGCDASVPL